MGKSGDREPPVLRPGHRGVRRVRDRCPLRAVLVPAVQPGCRGHRDRALLRPGGRLYQGLMIGPLGPGGSGQKTR
jgi:hypothetical protein